MEIDKERLIQIIENFNTKNIAVVGDFCLDEYIYGTAQSLSPEAPIPRVVIDSVEYVPGAAGNIASGVRALGAETYSCGVIGRDRSGEILKKALEEKGIYISGMIIDKNRNTPTYSRIVANGKQGQQLIRFDLENVEGIHKRSIDRIIKHVEQESSRTNAVIFADYDEVGTGLLEERFLKFLLNFSRENKILSVGMSRRNLDRFYGFGLLTLNEREVQNILGDGMKAADLERTGRKLVERLDSNIVLTKGEKGVSAFGRAGEIYHLPSFAKDVLDVTGAGDSLTAAITLSLVSGANLEEAVYIGNHAAAIAISKPGTTSVKPGEIKDRILAYER